jgi:hypothetical protein
VVTLKGIDIYLGPHGSIASRCEFDRLIGERLAVDAVKQRWRVMGSGLFKRGRTYPN